MITGAGNRSAIGTLVERSSRFTVLLQLPARHTAEAVRDALVQALAPLPVQLRRSLTWDQGSEMALHGEITRTLGMPAFFCEKASPWQRHWNGERAAIDILALARKRRAFRSLDRMLTRHSGPQVLAGSALALAAATETWSQHSNTPRAELIQTVIR